MRNKWFKIPLILLGNAVFAFGIAAFILPCGLLSGGTTGIALFIQHLCGLPVVITVWVINLSMLLLGWFVLGKNFVFTTILSSVCYPLFLDFFQRLLNRFRLTDDTLLSALFAGLLFVGAVGVLGGWGGCSGGWVFPRWFVISVPGFLFLFFFMRLTQSFCCHRLFSPIWKKFFIAFSSHC